jgi:hypothetical protein
MAEVRLLVKTSSEQAKKKLIEEGKVKSYEAEYYVESLDKFDSVEQSDYVKI